MDGMDICSNEPYFYVFIQLERTHEPCVPTYQSWADWCVKWLMEWATRMHVGTHGPCVRSNACAYPLKKPYICISFTLDGRASRASLHAKAGFCAV